MSALNPARMAELIATGATTRIDTPSQAPLLAVGDLLTTINDHRRTHTRLPRYARGKTGRVVKVHGMFAWPDSQALRAGARAQYVYAVSFAMTELWGPQGDPHGHLLLDIWEDYIAIP